jgi:hypothetical protein
MRPQGPQQIGLVDLGQTQALELTSFLIAIK